MQVLQNWFLVAMNSVSDCATRLFEQQPGNLQKHGVLETDQVLTCTVNINFVQGLICFFFFLEI